MFWRRTDPVQDVGALFVHGDGAAERLAAALGARLAVLGGLLVAHGEGWATVFAAPFGEERHGVLPRLRGALPLYDAGRGWWFPVGTAIDVPDHVRELLIGALATRYAIDPPAILIPRFTSEIGRSAEADAYVVGRAVPFEASVLLTGARAA
jgi:hypothetical protein